MNKYLGSSPSKIFWAILKMDKGKTWANRLKDEKTNDDGKTLHPRDGTDRFYVSRKEGIRLIN